MPSFAMIFSTLLILLTFGSLSYTSPLYAQYSALERRTDPFFPNQPPSCPICAQNYPNINSCAQASPVLANFSMIIFNPGAFIDVIKCACTDTFQSAFPQCVDCFVKTNQTDVLNAPDLPAIVDGMRDICGIESTLLGNVSVTDGEVTPSSSVPVPTPTASTSGSRERLLVASSLPLVSLLAFLSLIA